VNVAEEPLFALAQALAYLARQVVRTSQRRVRRQLPSTIDVKTFFTFLFYFGHVFTFLNVFLFSKRFFIFLKNDGKVQSGKQVNKTHFQKTATK